MCRYPKYNTEFKLMIVEFYKDAYFNREELPPQTVAKQRIGVEDV